MRYKRLLLIVSVFIFTLAAWSTFVLSAQIDPAIFQPNSGFFDINNHNYDINGPNLFFPQTDDPVNVEFGSSNRKNFIAQT